MEDDDAILRELAESGVFVVWEGRYYMRGAEPPAARPKPTTYQRMFLCMGGGPIDGGGVVMGMHAERYIGFSGFRWFCYKRLGPLYRMQWAGYADTIEAAGEL